MMPNNSSFFRPRVALLLVPVCAFVAAVAVLILYRDERGDRYADLYVDQTQSVASVLGQDLNRHREALLEVTPALGQDPAGACGSEWVRVIDDARLTVVDSDGSVLCGEAVPDKRLDDDSWSLFESELQLSVPFGDTWFVYSLLADALLLNFAGPDFPQELQLVAENGTTFAEYGNVEGNQPTQSFVAGIPGTSWRLKLHTTTASHSNSGVIALAVVVFSVAALPFAYGYRSWGRDAVRIADVARQVVIVLDEDLNPRHLSSQLQGGVGAPNLLSVAYPDDHDALIAALDAGPLAQPVRCRVRGFDFPIDMYVLSRGRVPCCPWRRRGQASGPGRFVRTSWIICQFMKAGGGSASVSRPVTTLDCDLVVRDVYVQHADETGIAPGDDLRRLVAETDRWKIDSLPLSQDPVGRWYEVTVRLLNGRIVVMSLCRTRAPGDGVLLKMTDVTATQLAADLTAYIGCALVDAETPRGRAVLDSKLLDLAGELAPGFQIRRSVGTDGRARIDFHHAGGVILDSSVRRAICTAERLTETIMRSPSQGNAETALRREMALLLHDKVMQPVVWARLRTASDPDSAQVLGDLLTLLRNTIDNLRIPPWQETLRAAISDAAEELRSHGIAVLIDIDLPQPLGVQEEMFVRRVIGECYSAVLLHDEVTQVVTSIGAALGNIVVRVTVDNWNTDACQATTCSFISALNAEVADAGGDFTVGTDDNDVFGALLRLPRLGDHLVPALSAGTS